MNIGQKYGYKVPLADMTRVLQATTFCIVQLHISLFVS